jgi:hypothetical protein
MIKGGSHIMKNKNSKLFAGFTIGIMAIGIYGYMLMFTFRSGHTATNGPGDVSAENIAQNNTGPSSTPISEPAADSAAVKYEGSVEHIFFHPLIAYPELAFDGDGLAKGYDNDTNYYTYMRENGNVFRRAGIARE